LVQVEGRGLRVEGRGLRVEGLKLTRPSASTNLRTPPLLVSSARWIAGRPTPGALGSPEHRSPPPCTSGTPLAAGIPRAAHASTVIRANPRVPPRQRTDRCIVSLWQYASRNASDDRERGQERCCGRRPFRTERGARLLSSGPEEEIDHQRCGVRSAGLRRPGSLYLERKTKKIERTGKIRGSKKDRTDRQNPGL